MQTNENQSSKFRQFCFPYQFPNLLETAYIFELELFGAAGEGHAVAGVCGVFASIRSLHLLRVSMVGRHHQDVVLKGKLSLSNTI